MERQAESDFEKRREWMERRPCAVNGMAMCSRECIHFHPGHGYMTRRFDDSQYTFVVTTYPRCKLWAVGD